MRRKEAEITSLIQNEGFWSGETFTKVKSGLEGSVRAYPVCTVEVAGILLGSLLLGQCHHPQAAVSVGH